MAKKLKVGVIGVGGIARAHFPGWMESPDAEMIAFADIDRAILEERGKQQDIKLLYDTGYDLIANKDIDIVDICTPNMFHAPLAIAAMQAGKHVICEKPLAPAPGEIRKMIAARNKSKKLLMTAQHFRFDGKSEAMKAMIDQGVLGNIYHARSWMLRRSGAPTKPTFIWKEKSGGGPCIDIGVHILDLTLWFMGHPKAVSVTGVTQDKLCKLKGQFSTWGGPIPKRWDVEEFAAAMVRFDTGATLVLEVSWLLHHKTDSEDMQMWLYGVDGGIHWPSNEILSTNYKAQQLINQQVLLAHTTEPHAKECMVFAKTVAGGGKSPVPPEESLDVITILDGLYKSAKAGKEVRL
ncbi:MAG TPA: Gfo/Idh/MocA family oxidoreductase [Candidatus Hydrogenedentes bacterium]|nr:Gfo/Idh/MocA family oxidoreductase [Candidatus Hydrogenedentota bacterium]